MKDTKNASRNSRGVILKKMILLVAVMGSLCSARAAVLVSQNASAPTGNLIAQAEQYNDATLNWNAYGTTSSTYRDVGQSFIAPENTKLGAFSFFIDSFESQAAGAAFTIKIFETNNPTVVLQDGTLLSTQYGVLPQTLIQKEYITFGLEEPVQLSAGKSYTVMLHFDEKGASNSAGSRRLVKFAIGSVSGENPLGANSGFWLSNVGTDFSEYYKDPKIMTASFQSIPEPTTALMIIGAGIFVGIARLRKTSFRMMFRRSRF